MPLKRFFLLAVLVANVVLGIDKIAELLDRSMEPKTEAPRNASPTKSKSVPVTSAAVDPATMTLYSSRYDLWAGLVDRLSAPKARELMGMSVWGWPRD